MDEDYSGLPLEENPVQERQSVKLFTMSHEDLSPRRSHDLPKGGSQSLPPRNKEGLASSFTLAFVAFRSTSPTP